MSGAIAAPAPRPRPSLLERTAAPARQRGTSQIAFFLLLLVNATVFLRPGEIVPALLGLPIYEALVLGSFAFCINDVRDRIGRSQIIRDPVTLCVLGIFVAIPLSHAQHAYLFGVTDSTFLFFKTLLYFLLLITLVDTPWRFQRFLLATVICASVMIGLCVLDYVEIFDLSFIEHVVDRDGETITGDQSLIVRMRGTGIFEDPNDLGLLILGNSVLLGYFLTERRHGSIRFLWIFPLFLMALALYYTRSRGALLGCGAAVMSFILFQYGKGWSLTVGGLGALALPLMAGRMGNIDIEDGTGQERIQMWAEGLAELKSANILFGVGQGMYADIAGLVAHNSFVHAYVELGFFGGTFFFGLFFFMGLALYRLIGVRFATHSTGLQRFAPYLTALIGGWSIGVFSLSRCYVVPTYLVVGIGTVYLQITARLQPVPRPIVRWDWPHIRLLLGASAGFLLFLFVLVRVLARFG